MTKKRVTSKLKSIINEFFAHESDSTLQSHHDSLLTQLDCIENEEYRDEKDLKITFDNAVRVEKAMQQLRGIHYIFA